MELQSAITRTDVLLSGFQGRKRTRPGIAAGRGTSWP